MHVRAQRLRDLEAFGRLVIFHEAAEGALGRTECATNETGRCDQLKYAKRGQIKLTLAYEQKFFWIRSSS